MWAAKKKKKKTPGGGVGVRALFLPLSFFSSLLSLSLRRTPLSERLEQAINSRIYCKTDLQSSSAVTISEVLTSYFLLYCLLLNGNFDNVYQNADWVIFPASCFYFRFFCVESGWGKVTCFWAVVCEWHASIHSRRWEGHDLFSLKKKSNIPNGPPFRIKTYAQDTQPRGESRRERLEPSIMQCIIQYGDHEPSSAFETKAFLLS